MFSTELQELEESSKEYLDAAKAGDVEKVRECIIIKGVDVEAHKDSFRAIHISCRNGHFHVVKYLLEECSADVHAKFNGGYTALHAASIGGHLNIVQYLVERYKVDISLTTNSGKTACQIACDNQKIDVVEYLSRRIESLNAVRTIPSCCLTTKCASTLMAFPLSSNNEEQ